MSTEIKQYSQENWESLRKGINTVADTVKITFGPYGKYVIIKKDFGPPLITADGAVVIDEIKPADEFEALGAEIQQDIARKVSAESGDGRTAAAIITKVIVNEGFKNIVAGANAMEIRRGLITAKEAVIKYLASVTEQNPTLEQIGQVAGIAAGDKEAGPVIAKVLAEAGKDGIVSVEESKKPGITSEVVKGFHFDRGYLPPYANSPDGGVTLQNIPFLITDKHITESEDIAPVVERLLADGKKEMVIIAEDVSHNALTWLNQCKTKGAFIAIIIKKPGVGEDGRNQLEDLALFTGTKVISQTQGDVLAETPLEMLGKAGRVMSSKVRTIIMSGAGNKEDVDARVVQLKTELEKTEAELEKEKLKGRIAKLTSGVGVLKVGFATDTEHGNIKKIEDALNAANGAGEEGVVPGGGSTLVMASVFLDTLFLPGDQQIGVNILKKALETPMHQLAQNSGDDGGMVVAQYKIREIPGHGYNAETRHFEHLTEMGVIDSIKTVKATIHYPVMACATLLNAGAGIIKVKEKKADN